eukprot:623896-Amphidinium_carterae.1
MGVDQAPRQAWRRLSSLIVLLPLFVDECIRSEWRANFAQRCRVEKQSEVSRVPRGHRDTDCDRSRAGFAT